jgi:hypothetical protein
LTFRTEVGGGRVLRLLDGSVPRSLVGAVRPFDRVLKTHTLRGGPHSGCYRAIHLQSKLQWNMTLDYGAWQMAGC